MIKGKRQKRRSTKTSTKGNKGEMYYYYYYYYYYYICYHLYITLLNSTPEKNHVPSKYSVAAILFLLFMVHISLFALSH